MTKDEAEKSFWISIISLVLFSVFGIYLMLKPDTTIAMISKVLALITLAISIFGIVRYFIRKDKTKKIDINIIYGLIALIIALILYFNPYLIKGIIPIALGGFMLINIVLKIGYIKQVRKNEKSDFGVCIFTFIMMLILSALVILNPLNSNQILGMTIMFYQVLDVILCYLFKNNIL